MELRFSDFESGCDFLLTRRRSARVLLCLITLFARASQLRFKLLSRGSTLFRQIQSVHLGAELTLELRHLGLERQRSVSLFASLRGALLCRGEQILELLDPIPQILFQLGKLGAIFFNHLSQRSSLDVSLLLRLFQRLLCDLVCALCRSNTLILLLQTLNLRRHLRPNRRRLGAHLLSFLHRRLVRFFQLRHFIRHASHLPVETRLRAFERLCAFRRFLLPSLRLFQRHRELLRRRRTRTRTRITIIVVVPIRISSVFNRRRRARDRRGRLRFRRVQRTLQSIRHSYSSGRRRSINQSIRRTRRLPYPSLGVRF